MTAPVTLDDPLAIIEQSTFLANGLREVAEQIPPSEPMSDILDAADMIGELVILANQAWASALTLTMSRPQPAQALVVKTKNVERPQS